jgi:DNA-binding protein HU-beta
VEKLSRFASNLGQHDDQANIRKCDGETLDRYARLILVSLLFSASKLRATGSGHMNKAELVEKVAKKTALTKLQSEQVLDAALEVISKAVAKGDEVKLVGFGTFSKSVRKSRQGRNPKTGTKLVIPAAQVPKFKAGKDFRELCK